MQQHRQRLPLRTLIKLRRNGGHILHHAAADCGTVWGRSRGLSCRIIVEYCIVLSCAVVIYVVSNAQNSLVRRLGIIPQHSSKT